jgi:hypothetical protein
VIRRGSPKLSSERFRITQADLLSFSYGDVKATKARMIQAS